MRVPLGPTTKKVDGHALGGKPRSDASTTARASLSDVFDHCTTNSSTNSIGRHLSCRHMPHGVHESRRRIAVESPRRSREHHAHKRGAHGVEQRIALALQISSGIGHFVSPAFFEGADVA
jgi:hypothetical protein